MKIKLTGVVGQHRSDTFEQNPRKRREREWSRKRIYRNNCQTFPKLDERYKFTDSRRLARAPLVAVKTLLANARDTSSISDLGGSHTLWSN